jgi:hypothetical protein
MPVITREIRGMPTSTRSMVGIRAANVQSEKCRMFRRRPASGLSYLALRLLTKRTPSWLRYTAPIFVLAILVAGWRYAGARFSWYRV